MKRPAYARMVHTDIVYVVDSYREAALCNEHADPMRYVAATEDEHNWDMLVGKTLCFLGRWAATHPYAAMRAGVSSVFFVNLDGEMQQWRRA